MGRTAIITDSTSYIPDELLENHDIHMVPLNVVFGAESYKEIAELTVDDFYGMIKTEEKLPTTSQPSAGLFAEKYEALKEAGYEEAVVLTLSSSISGTYQSASTATEMVDDFQVHVFDSEISCMAQGFYVLEAAEMANDGQSAEDILARLEKIRAAGVKAYFMVDDLSHLRRGGRLSSAQFVVGSLLQVKPLLTFRDKQIIPMEKIRTRKKALNRIYDLFHEDASNDTELKASVIHANRHEEAKQIANTLREKYPKVDVSISVFGPVIGTHVGEGTLGLTWYRP